MANGTTVVIASAARTPMGSFQGSLSTVPAPILGSVAIQAAVERAQIAVEQVDEVLMGCVLSAGLKQAPARQASLAAQLPQGVGATTVNKVCGSGMKTLMMAHDMVQAGTLNVAVAGGMENMSHAPYLLDKVRNGLRMGHSQVLDHMFLDGLEDAYTGKAMGVFAQQTADALGFEREQMDAFALESLRRAQTAIDGGAFAPEIAPVAVTTRHGEQQVTVDEQPSKARPEKIPHLRPAFVKDGTITAANSSSISDGAAALVVTSAAYAQANRMPILAIIKGHASHAQLPNEFTLAPVGALSKLLNKLGWQPSDVDLFEINEAFAMVTMAAIQALELDANKVNIYGGACALGHPIGCSGSRIVVTLLHALQAQGLKRGVASLCIGGGEAVAMAIELA